MVYNRMVGAEEPDENGSNIQVIQVLKFPHGAFRKLGKLSRVMSGVEQACHRIFILCAHVRSQPSKERQSPVLLNIDQR